MNRKVLFELPPDAERWLENQRKVHFSKYGCALSRSGVAQAAMAALAATKLDLGSLPSDLHITTRLVDIIRVGRSFSNGSGAPRDQSEVI
jgi:hypothetical protein